MKFGMMQIVGGFILLGCMAFALVKLGSADQWVAMWIPFVVAGVALAFFGTVIQRQK